jgi:hypothetical protein
MSDIIADANSEKVDQHVMPAALKTSGGDLKKVSIPPALSNHPSVEEWAERIGTQFRRSVEATIAAGRHLHEAKHELDTHGQWLPLLKRLKVGASMAARLMRIAENEVLTNSAHWAELPSSWRTLYELTKLPPETLEAKIADGTITPETKREEVRALINAEPGFDWEKEWIAAGMPSFRMDPPKPCQKIIISFMRWEDVEAFGKLIGQPVTPRTKSFWYPPQPKKSRKDLMCHDTVPDPNIDGTPYVGPTSGRMNKQVDGAYNAPKIDACEPPQMDKGHSGGGIKFVITQSDKMQLRERGFTDAQIAELKPEDVSKIIAQPRAR